MNAHDPAFRATNDPWSFFWDRGYRRLLPISPPDAVLTETSRIDPGKAPGVRHADGRWSGLGGWSQKYATEADLGVWRSWEKAGIGIICDEGLTAFDADTLDPKLAAAIRAAVESRFGLLPLRFGQEPKAVFLCRTDAEFTSSDVEFEGGVFEVRTSGQFVAYGIHKITKKPYRWERAPPARDKLPYFAPSAIEALIADLLALLPNARLIAQGSRTAGRVDQATLQAPSADAVARALGAIPNDRGVDRTSWIKMGHAIHAATRGSEDGRRMWEDWSAEWIGPRGARNAPEIVEKEWRSFGNVDKRVGWSWMLHAADERTGGKFSPGEFFEAPAVADGCDISSQEPLFPEHPIEPELETRSAATFGAHEAPPPQRWLAGTLIPARQVTMLFGDGGTGKSLAALQLAASVAAGRPWLGLPTMKGPALFLTAEDEIDEVHRRLAQLVKADGLEWSELADLHIASLDGEDATLATVNPKTGGMVRTALFERLETTLTRLRPVLCVLDTLADLFGGDEIKRLQARQFIGMLRGQIARADFELTEVLLAHPSVAGMANDSGSSGSTAWSNSVRSRLYLKRRYTDKEKTREIDPDVRVLAVRKANRARAGGDMTLRWTCGRFVALEGLKAAEDDEDAADEMAFLDFLDSFSRSNRFASESPTSSNYAPRAFAKESGGGKIGEARLAKAMGRLFGRERPAIVNIDYGSPSRKKQRIARAPEAGEPDLFG